MAQWLSHTNQKLYQTRLLLDELDSIDVNAADSLNSALEESVLFQMMLSYQSYLHEVAEIAHCQEDFHALTELIDLASVGTGEMTELKQLEDDDFSWLAQMMSAFQQCAQKDSLPAKSAQSNSSMIQLHNQPITSLPLRQWFNELSELIDLQRNNRQES